MSRCQIPPCVRQLAQACCMDYDKFLPVMAVGGRHRRICSCGRYVPPRYGMLFEDGGYRLPFSYGFWYRPRELIKGMSAHQCFCNGVFASGNSEFLHNIANIHFDRPLANTQNLSNLSVGLTHANPFQHLILSPRKFDICGDSTAKDIRQSDMKKRNN